MIEFRSAVLVTLGLMAMQAIVIVAITLRHGHLLNRFKAEAYPDAIAALAKASPWAANTIRVCYALCLIELLILVVLKLA